MPLRRIVFAAAVTIAIVYLWLAALETQNTPGSEIGESNFVLTGLPLATCDAIREGEAIQSGRLEWTWEGAARAALFRQHGFHWANSFDYYGGQPILVSHQ